MTEDDVTIEPVVLMLVLPPMTDDPLIVDAVISAPLSSLLVKVSAASRVTITPSVGKVAVDATPVPPFAVAKAPVTAAELAKFSAPKLGVPPPAGTTKT